MKKEVITGYPNLDISLYNRIGTKQKIDLWYEACLENLYWETGFIKIFGKNHQIPRLQAWYADQNIEYRYSGKKLNRHDWNGILLEIKLNIEALHLINLTLFLQIYTEMEMILWGSMLMMKKNLASIL